VNDLNLLVPEFRERVEAVLQACASDGLTMRPFFTVRSTRDQGGLWRQSRSREEVNAMVTALLAKDCQYLAAAIISAGPRTGRWATNAVPGNSWHQWGEAIDCVVMKNGRADWEDIKAYQRYRGIGQALGLFIGPKNDWVHLQLRPDSAPGRLWSLKAINDELKRRGV
jgi:hypothetical protein